MKLAPLQLVGNNRLISTVASELSCLLNKCSNLKHIQQTHGFMITRALDHDNLLLTQLSHACSSLGFSLYAYSILTHASQPDIYLFNTLIKALSSSPSSAPLAILLYNRIQSACLRPDCYTLPFALKAVCRLRAVDLGRQIHCQGISTGLDSNIHVTTALIQMYSSTGHVSDARQLFDKASSTDDVAFWNAMVAGYVRVGEVDAARALFDRMPKRNVISWTTLIAGYAQMDHPIEAISIFRRMQLENVNPDEVAMLAALSACAHLGAFELGEWIYSYIHQHRLNKTIPLCNALIDMYAKSGNIGKALRIFDKMTNKTVITWTTMIAGLALHGLGREALEIFSRMERAGVKPNEITFIAILSACSHGGLVELGLWFFKNMGSRYGIQPNVEHYGCVIDLLGRAGYLREAQELLRLMPFEANAAIWGSLLTASNIHGSAELGERALWHLLQLEPWNSGNYALLSNIYASTGRWKESGKTRSLMREKGVRKTSGWSFIEVNNTVYEFVAADISHPDFDRIHDVLCKINAWLKIAEHQQKDCGGLLEFG